MLVAGNKSHTLHLGMEFGAVPQNSVTFYVVEYLGDMWEYCF